MQVTNEEALLVMAEEIAQRFPDNIRHPVIAEHNREVTALAYAALCLAERSDHMNLKLIMETAFMLGYDTGRKDSETPDSEVWDLPELGE